MFTSKKNSRGDLFKKAMLGRGKRTLTRRSQPSGEEHKVPLTAIFLWSAFGIVSGYMLFFSPALLITQVEVRGESILPLTEYETVGREWIDGHYLRIVPKRNLLLIRPRALESVLLERYPKLSRVSVHRVFPSTLQIYLDEAPLLLRWCSGGPCYTLRDGRAAILPGIEDTRYDSVRLSIIDTSARPVTVGADFPVNEYFETQSFLHQEFGRVVSTSLKQTAMTPSRHSNELMFTTEEGWSFFVATDRPAEPSLGALQVFLTEYAKDYPDRSDLSWVDLRIEGKIFYADRNREASELVPVEEEKE